MKRRTLNGNQQLTTREQAFVENVAAGENQTKAVEKAGDSKRSAKVIGSQLLNKQIVRDAIRERKAHAYRGNDLCVERAPRLHGPQAKMLDLRPRLADLCPSYMKPPDSV